MRACPLFHLSIRALTCPEVGHERAEWHKLVARMRAGGCELPRRLACGFLPLLPRLRLSRQDYFYSSLLKMSGEGRGVSSL